MNKVDFVRRCAPGYLGGQEIIEKATDIEIQLLIDLKEESTRHQNIADGLQATINHIQKAIKTR